MTPLTIILTSLQNLNNGTGDNQTLYGVMSANATRLMRLIQQILEFRKVESGNLKIRVSHGDVVGFVRRCVEAFAPLVARKQLKVYFRASSEQVDGWFDPAKLDTCCPMRQNTRPTRVKLSSGSKPETTVRSAFRSPTAAN